MGQKWQHWKNGLPPVQIRDLAIQETFDDLVFGTFGRAFWVLDDIGPLRQYAKSKYTSNNRSYQGIRFIGQAEFVGENKSTNAMISMWIKPDSKEPKEEKEAKEAKGDKKMSKKENSKKE